MEIGPLEYVVIGLSGQQHTRALLSELNAIQASGQIRVVDLIFVTKTADGGMEMREVHELSEDEPEAYTGIKDDLMGLLTAEDVEQLTSHIPANNPVIVILFEHTWVLGLTETVRKSGGVVFNGGMVSHDVLASVSAELAAMKEEQDA